jgi:hypothetical protein
LGDRRSTQKGLKEPSRYIYCEGGKYSNTSWDVRAVKEKDLSSFAAMRVGSIPTPSKKTIFEKFEIPKK